jgi:hypothetical protein
MEIKISLTNCLFAIGFDLNTLIFCGVGALICGSILVIMMVGNSTGSVE